MGKTIEALQDKRVVEVVNHALQYGDDSAAENFGVNHESLARYKREFRSRFGDFDRRALLEKIASHYTTEELKTIAAGQRGTIGTRKHIVSRAGEKVKIGFMSDTHIGSIYFRDEMFAEAIRIMTEEGCDFIVHAGDVTEGMSNRPDQIYELSELGYAAQKQKAIELLGMWDGPMYLIDGNHDRWFVKSSGAYIVEDIAGEIGAIYLGQDEGDIVLDDCIIKLWHGEDASSYAVSYRLQKLIESFTGGEKPNVLLCGHTHKHGYFFDRNIHVVSGGALSMQSRWMRGKRFANHSGFHILDMTITPDGVTRFQVEWFPFFL